MGSDSRKEFKESIVSEAESDDDLDSAFSQSNNLQLKILQENNRHEQVQLRAQQNWFDNTFGCGSNAATAASIIIIIICIASFVGLTIYDHMDSAKAILAFGATALGYMFGKNSSS